MKNTSSAILINDQYPSRGAPWLHAAVHWPLATPGDIVAIICAGKDSGRARARGDARGRGVQRPDIVTVAGDVINGFGVSLGRGSRGAAYFGEVAGSRGWA